VVESQEGIFVTPAVEPLQTLELNSFVVISDPHLYPESTYLATGESVVV
jgi:hypothetical protein